MKKNNGVIGFTFFYTEEILNKSIDCLGELSIRSQNCLKRAQYDTIGDIIEHWDDLPKIRNFGSKSVKEVRSAIFNYNVERLNEKDLKRFVETFTFQPKKSEVY